MHPADWRLINGDFLEAIPAALGRGRGNATARRLAQSDWLLHQKSDGRFIAVRRGEILTELHRGGLTPELRDDLASLAQADAGIGMLRPMHGLLERLRRVGLAEDYGERSGLSLVAEPGVLSYAGRDRYQRPLWLTDGAARAWRAMQAAALQHGVMLQAISGYRSHDYQLGIFQRKLARGQSVDEILTVNAAPGYSEHHGGNALDIGTPGEPAAEESFEHTPAFEWLGEHAGRFGFSMSYPRNNRHGIVYEPWHWLYAPG